jgi:hypothetical protein
MDMTSLFFAQGNDIIVTASFPTISDGTGMNSEFWYKTDRTTPDNDPTSVMYEASVVPDPDNAGQTMSQFTIPATANESAGAFWWRVDLIDIESHRRTANAGPLLVESV